MNKNLVKFLSILAFIGYFVVVLWYTINFVELTVLLINAPKSVDTFEYLSTSNPSSNITSLLNTITFLNTRPSISLQVIDIFAILVLFIKGFSILEIALLVLILYFSIVKNLSFSQSRIISSKSILRSLNLIILLILISNLVFSLLLPLESIMIIDNITLNYLSAAVFGLCAIIILFYSCFCLYKPLKKRIYAPLN